MRSAFGVMAAAAATVVVAAWRRVQREGVEARIARRARETAHTTDAAPLPARSAPIEPVGVSSRSESLGRAGRFEPVEINVVPRTMPPEPELEPEPMHVEPLRAPAPAPPAGAPARAEAARERGPSSQNEAASSAAAKIGRAHV